MIRQLSSAALVMCVGCASLASGEPPISGADVENFAGVDRLMVRFIAEHDVPGASVAIAQSNEVLYARGFGYANVEQKSPVKPQTRFRIASVSKPITAAAVAALVVDGKLDFDDKLFSHLSPDQRAGAHKELADVTIDQLLRHRAGWDRNATFDPMFRSVQIGRELGLVRPATQAQIVSYMLARPPDVAPGAKYVYSNFGYCLLGRVIARASGQPYEKYVRQRVLAPLEMKSTQLGNSLRAAADEATYYAQPQVLSQGVVPGVLGKRVETQYGGWNLELLDANGGWISTASDLAKFASAFDGRRDWISPKVLATMHSPLPAERDKAPYYYAHGWLVRPVPGRGANIWHNGALLGTSSLLVRRHDGLCWAVLFNSRDDKDGNLLSSTIDPLIYRALDRIELQPAE